MSICLFSLSKEVRESTRLYYFEPRVIKGENKDDCWEWTGCKSTWGYPHLSRRFGKEKYTWKAHRLAWLFRYNCPVPKELNCCHTCDNRGCVNPEHIFLATQKANVQDAKRKGRLTRRKQINPLK